MKILVVCQYYFPEQFRINDICETLVSLGHDVTVLTGLPNYPQGKVYPNYRWFNKRKETINGVKVIRSWLIGRGNNFFQLSLNYISYIISASFKTLLLEKDFDIVFVYQLSPVTMALPALLYKKITGKKIYLYCLDIWPDSIAAARIKHNSIFYKILLKLSKSIYLNVDYVSVTSSEFIDYFKQLIGVSEGRIDYLPQYAEDLYAEKLESTNLKSDNSIDLLFAGNIGEMQSVETLIKAAAELKEHTQVKWHIVGDGSARAKCERLASDLGLLGTVTFYGKRPLSEMPDFYSMASALLVTLKDDDFISYTLPGKVQSYMAAGKPIIGAINGETKRVIEQAECGLCCAAEDYLELATIVKQFALDTTKHKMYAANSRNYYEYHFSKKVYMKRLLESFKMVSKNV